MRRREVAAILNQEHWTPSHGIADLQHHAKGLGWKLAPAPAAKGANGGPSAGVGVLVPSHLGWSAAPGATWDMSPPGSPGRVAAAWVQTGLVGVLVVSVYLWTSEGLTPRNVTLVERALWAARSYGSLWIIGGDFNVPPAALSRQLDRLLSRAGAVVRAPVEATHYPSRGAPEVLDYFLVDSRLDVGFKGVSVDLDVGLKPHRVVSIAIEVHKAAGLISTLRKPRAFPRQRPTGCARLPAIPDATVIEEGSVAGGNRGLERLWATTMDCVEHELCGVFDLVDQCGAPPVAVLRQGRAACGGQTAYLASPCLWANR